MSTVSLMGLGLLRADAFLLHVDVLPVEPHTLCLHFLQ